jgi:hypothetical protein
VLLLKKILLNDKRIYFDFNNKSIEMILNEINDILNSLTADSELNNKPYINSPVSNTIFTVLSKYESNIKDVDHSDICLYVINTISAQIFEKNSQSDKNINLDKNIQLIDMNYPLTNIKKIEWEDLDKFSDYDYTVLFYLPKLIPQLWTIIINAIQKYKSKECSLKSNGIILSGVLFQGIFDVVKNKEGVILWKQSCLKIRETYEKLILNNEQSIKLNIDIGTKIDNALINNCSGVSTIINNY